MNKQLEIGKKKTLDTMSKVVSEATLKILADVIDREFGNLNQELDETTEFLMNAQYIVTLGEQLSKTREAIQAIIDKANEANNALKNAGIGNGADSTPTVTPTAPTGHESDSGLGSTTHDNSGTTLPNAGTWKNADQDIAKDKAEAANTAKKAIDKIVQVEEKKKNQGSSKLTVGGSSKSKFTTISKGYASGTQSNSLPMEIELVPQEYTRKKKCLRQ